MRFQRGFFGLSTLTLIGAAAALAVLVSWSAWTWWLVQERDKLLAETAMARQSAKMWETAHAEQLKLLRASERAIAERDSARRELKLKYTRLEGALEEALDDDKEVEDWAGRSVPGSVTRILRERTPRHRAGDEDSNAAAGADS